MDKIEPHKIYTTGETREFLKISKSTIKRWLKKGIIRANKIGGRYKILGSEILRLISPDLEEETRHVYRDLKEKTKKKIKNW
ncbi:helix-turn-helix domain-containing protein [Patescibacteria group bacterium]|nr:helix-turn-helix domain-containing protein [Patescibacteria group bacterium]